MPLTVKKVENAKQKERLYRLVDGRGLYLEVPPNGRKRWKYRYKLNGKDDTVSIGLYPDMKLAEAREIHSELYRVRASGLCPKAYYKDQKNKASDRDSFEAVTREWFAKFKQKWAEQTGIRKMARLESHVFPLIGSLPIDQVDAPQIRRVLLRLEALDKLHTGHRVKNIIGEVMRYAVAMGLILHNPVPDLAGVLPPTNENHRASITNPKEIGGLLRAIDEYTGSPVTRCALKLAAVTFVRPGELRHAEWSEIDYEGKEWRIPAEKMKMKRPHIVPLSRQAIAFLKDVELVTGHGRFVFPSERSSARPMSNNTVNAALRRMGFTKEEMTGHGFRSMASTNLNELGFHPDHIERQLAHVEANKVRAAYNYAEHLPERKKMMQAWADYLDTLKDGGKVIPLHVKALGKE